MFDGVLPRARVGGREQVGGGVVDCVFVVILMACLYVL